MYHFKVVRENRNGILKQISRQPREFEILFLFFLFFPATLPTQATLHLAFSRSFSFSLDSFLS